MSGREYSVVVPILNPNMAEDLVRLAVALAGVNTPVGIHEKRRVRVVVLGIVAVPEDTPLSQGTSLVKAYRKLLHYIPSESGRHSENVEIRTEVRVARKIWQGIASQVREEDADLLLLHWKGNTQSPGKIYGDTIDPLMEDPPCDIVLARLNSLPEIKSILLPVRGGSYSNLAMQLVSNLAEEWAANVTVMHNVSPKSPKVGIPTGTQISPRPSSATSYRLDTNASTNFNSINLHQNLTQPVPVRENDISAIQKLLAELPPGARLLTTQGSPEVRIAGEAALSDLLVLGASEENNNNWKSQDKESLKLIKYIFEQSSNPILVVKTRKPLRLSSLKVGSQNENELKETVDRWFAQNTFHYREYRSLSSLTLLKERNNQSISLIFPVYGSTQPVTLAEAVRRARYALMRDCALIDEIIISAPGLNLDENEVKLLHSKTDTEGWEKKEIIYLNGEGNEEIPDFSGPGLALWNALQIARGDIIVWANPHDSSFEARRFYGLVGPLLSYPEFQLALGFFSNPLSTNPEQSYPVHKELLEIAARPLLSGIFPALSGVIDPLLLTGAARRDHLEHLPLFTHTGITPALMIDSLARTGLMSIAQVDLGSPPENDPQFEPQRAVSDLLEVLLRRAGERTQSAVINLYSPSVKQVQKIGDVYSLNVITPTNFKPEIKPLIYTPGYLRHSF